MTFTGLFVGKVDGKRVGGCVGASDTSTGGGVATLGEWDGGYSNLVFAQFVMSPNCDAAETPLLMLFVAVGPSVGETLSGLGRSTAAVPPSIYRPLEWVIVANWLACDNGLGVGMGVGLDVGRRVGKRVLSDGRLALAAFPPPLTFAAPTTAGEFDGVSTGMAVVG